MRTAIVGASGYTGAELVRIIARHPNLTISALAADRNAGREFHEVFPAYRNLDLPPLKKFQDLDMSAVDLAFCALPHGTSQEVVAELAKSVPVIDLSADFRLRDPGAYENWYGLPHSQIKLQQQAVYGLTEFYREQIAQTRLVACTGCNAAAGLYALIPLVAEGAVDLDRIVIDLKTGVSGAGRSPKETSLFAEVAEGFQAYSVAAHRHMAEFDQELARFAERKVHVTFVPHLLPQNRGILATIYVVGDSAAIHRTLSERYADEHFLTVLPLGSHPSTRHVRGSNFVHIGVVPDRRSGHAIIFSALDNLTKGSSGQAVQNANVMLGLSETAGLEFLPVVP